VTDQLSGNQSISDRMASTERQYIG
jgi:hypothetical protein